MSKKSASMLALFWVVTKDGHLGGQYHDVYHKKN